jgi:hypothetical protein
MISNSSNASLGFVPSVGISSIKTPNSTAACSSQRMPLANAKPQMRATVQAPRAKMEPYIPVPGMQSLSMVREPQQSAISKYAMMGS